MEKTVNVTIKINATLIPNFERLVNGSYGQVISFRILTDTEELYKNDSHFKALVKSVKDAQNLRDNYINEKNHG